MLDDFKPSQQKIIERYYRALDAITKTRLAELVTDIYLAEGKKKDRLWENVRQVLIKLELPEARILHLMDKKDPTLLAALVKELSG